MFKQRLMLGFAAALAASLATQLAVAQCRGGGGGGGRMGSMGGQMGMMGRQMGNQMGMMGRQMGMMGGGGPNGMMANQMGNQMAMMGGSMMNAALMQGGQGRGQGQGQGGGGMCKGQMGGQMGSNNGNLSANPMGRPRGLGGQTPNGIYAQVLSSAGSSQASATGVRSGQTQQQSVLTAFDANGSGKLEGVGAQSSASRGEPTTPPQS